MIGVIAGGVGIAALLACVVYLCIRGGSDTDYPSENGDGEE